MLSMAMLLDGEVTGSLPDSIVSRDGGCLLTLAEATGVVGFYSDLTHADPPVNAVRSAAACLVGVEHVQPVLFAHLDPAGALPSVGDDCYQLVLEDADPAHIVLVKGPLSGVGTTELRRSTVTFPRSQRLELRLDLSIAGGFPALSASYRPSVSGYYPALFAPYDDLAVLAVANAYLGAAARFIACPVGTTVEWADLNFCSD